MMRIENVTRQVRGDRTRLRADLVWESRQDRSREMYFEVSNEFASSMLASPDPFVAAAVPLASWSQEERLWTEGRVCSCLRDGLRAVLDAFERWYPSCRSVALEADEGFAASPSLESRRTACFLSGGIDSLSLLRANLRDYPRGHPGRIEDCLILFGLNTHDFDEATPRRERLQAFERYRDRLATLTESVGCTLVPVTTNTRALYPSWTAWVELGCGAGTLSAALALGGRLTDVWIASAGVGAAPRHRGFHPMINPSFSTASVRVHHGQAATSRTQKVRLLADWEPAWPVVRTCLYHEVPAAGRYNCGSCEKCVRTMLEFLVVGRLDRITSFEADDVTVEMIEGIEIDDPEKRSFYLDLLEPLEAMGRSDLSEAVRSRLATGPRRHPRLASETGSPRRIPRPLDRSSSVWSWIGSLLRRRR